MKGLGNCGGVPVSVEASRADSPVVGSLSQWVAQECPGTSPETRQDGCLSQKSPEGEFVNSETRQGG